MRPNRPLLVRRKPDTGIVWAVMLAIAYLEYYLRCYRLALVSDHPEDDPYLSHWKSARDGTALLFLVLGYLQYYYMDVFAQIAALPRLEVYV
jgi:hypothetical protein